MRIRLRGPVQFCFVTASVEEGFPTIICFYFAVFSLFFHKKLFDGWPCMAAIAQHKSRFNRSVSSSTSKSDAETSGSSLKGEETQMHAETASGTSKLHYSAPTYFPACESVGCGTIFSGSTVDLLCSVELPLGPGEPASTREHTKLKSIFRAKQ